MESLTALYQQWAGVAPATIWKLAGAGSNRAYYRMVNEDGTTVIGVVGTSRDENHAFISLARHFYVKGLSVPEILAVSDDEMRYLQTDLGSVSLFDCLKSGRENGGSYTEEQEELLLKVIRELPRIQIYGAEGLDWDVCYPQPEFDEMNVMFDLHYFKYCYLKATGIDFHEVQLERDFRSMASDLTERKQHFFMYRDFQARNVMVGSSPGEQGKVSFIDFQGGRRGPFYYDVASFLWQASARYPDTLRQRLINEYYDALMQYTDVPPRMEFDKRLHLFVLFRVLQVLGAYGFRGYFERKQHFIDSIPPALDNLHKLLGQGVCKDYPYLEQILTLLPHPSSGPSQSSSSSLVVRIFSFSYKKGIPDDDSGHGGGYVFDCRSTHNPGRYDEYKQLTGLDDPVIRFLEEDGEITTFLESVYRLADHHVQRYIERGFTSLMFSFGCTGGQHRSVYSAQHLAHHIHEKFGIEVRLCHREQGIEQILSAKSHLCKTK